MNDGRKCYEPGLPPSPFECRWQLPVHLAGAVSDGESWSGWAGEGCLGGYCPGDSGLTPPRPGFQEENVYLNHRAPLS